MAKLLAIPRIWFLVIVFAFSIAVPLISWIIMPDGFSEVKAVDYNEFYKPVALNILSGKSITLDNVWATRNPPGFPYIIAFFGWFSHQLSLTFRNMIALMTLIFSAGSASLLFLIGERIWGKLGGFITALVWISYPISIYLSTQPNPEIPFIFFLLASIYLVFCAKDSRFPLLCMFFAGIFIGISMLIRPLAIGLGAAIAFLYWFTSRPKSKIVLLGVLIFIMGNLLIIFPWEYVTYQKTGTIIPLANNGFNSMRDGWTYPADTKSYRELFDGPEDVKALARFIYDQSSTGHTSSEFLKLLIGSFENDPITFFKFTLFKITSPWYGTDSGKLDRYIMFFQLPYFICIISSLFLIMVNTHIPKSYFIFATFITLYFWAMAFIALPILRYLLPAFPLLFLSLPILVLKQGEVQIKNA
jgi:4-amino-4-deoxy-L-arabinose transferase-like glycosyltransferase